MRLIKLFGLLFICLVINIYFLINKTVEANNNTFNQSCLSPAKINKVTPESAKITENIEVTVKGENFTQTTRIFLGDNEASNISVKSPSELTFRIPEQTRSGRRTLSILTECGLTQHPFIIFPEALENVEPGFVTTVVGTASIYVGDGKPATNTDFLNPSGVIFDKKGDLLIADVRLHRIRKVDSQTGIITTVAGNGIAEFSGDGKHALTASLVSPRSLAEDSQGNLFIADTGNNRIRRVDASTGIITTVAGGGFNFLIKPEGSQALEIVLTPSDIVIDQDDRIFISSIESRRVFILDVKTGIIKPFVGTGFRTDRPSGDGGNALKADLAAPRRLALDQKGNLYITDSNLSQLKRLIRKVDITTSIITTVAGGGGSNSDGILATQFSFLNPGGIALDPQGNLFIADGGTNKIKRVDAITGIITTVAGTGKTTFNGDGILANQATLNFPTDVVVKDNSLFIADILNGRVRKVDLSTQAISSVAFGEIFFTSFNDFANISPIGTDSKIVVDKTNNMFFTQLAQKDDGSRFFFLKKVDFMTKLISEVDIDKVGVFTLLAIDKEDNLIVEAKNTIKKINMQTNEVTLLAGNGRESSSGDGGLAVNAGMHPKSLVLDTQGNLFINDDSSCRIRKVDIATGIITTVAGTNCIPSRKIKDGKPAIEVTIEPNAISVDKLGNLFISETFKNRVRIVDAKTGIITTYAGNGKRAKRSKILEGVKAPKARLVNPRDIALDSNDNLYIADGFNIRVVHNLTQRITSLTMPECCSDTSKPTLAKDAAIGGSFNTSRLFIDDKDNLFIGRFNRVFAIKPILP